MNDSPFGVWCCEDKAISQIMPVVQGVSVGHGDEDNIYLHVTKNGKTIDLTLNERARDYLVKLLLNDTESGD